MFDAAPAVEAGALMAYGRIRAEGSRRDLHGQDSQGRQASRPAGRAADEVRVGRQSKNRSADRINNTAECARKSRSRHPMTRQIVRRFRPMSWREQTGHPVIPQSKIGNPKSKIVRIPPYVLA